MKSISIEFIEVIFSLDIETKEKIYSKSEREEHINCWTNDIHRTHMIDEKLGQGTLVSKSEISFTRGLVKNMESPLKEEE